MSKYLKPIKEVDGVNEIQASPSSSISVSEIVNEILHQVESMEELINIIQKLRMPFLSTRTRIFPEHRFPDAPNKALDCLGPTTNDGR